MNDIRIGEAAKILQSSRRIYNQSVKNSNLSIWEEVGLRVGHWLFRRFLDRHMLLTAFRIH